MTYKAPPYKSGYRTRDRQGKTLYIEELPPSQNLMIRFEHVIYLKSIQEPPLLQYVTI